jgi:outer membrane protein assembly factor BamB
MVGLALMLHLLDGESADVGLKNLFARIRWKLLLRIFGGVLLVFVILWIAAYFLLWVPVRALNDRNVIKNASPEKMRDLSHRAIRFSQPHHDAFIYLSDYGDETSVPLLISCLRWMPRDRGFRECTWDHCLGALVSITNCNPGETYDDWARWYTHNRGKARTDWIAQGFSNKGLAVDSHGSPEMAGFLLAHLGQSEWEKWRVGSCEQRNAKTLLDHYDQNVVRDVIHDVISSGSVAAKRGVAWYYHKNDKPKYEDSLRQLMKDQDRTVRICASGALCRYHLNSKRNPFGKFEKSQPLDFVPQHRGAVSDGIFYVPTIGDKYVAYGLSNEKIIWETKAQGGMPTLKDNHVYFGSLDGTMVCLSAQDGTLLWRTRLSLEHRLYAVQPPTVIDSLVAGDDTVKIAKTEFSALIALVNRADGTLLKVLDGKIAGASKDHLYIKRKGRFLALKAHGLSEVFAFDTEAEILGVVEHGDTACVVLSTHNPHSWPSWGEFWIEGWSLSTGRRQYRTDINKGGLDHGMWVAQIAPGRMVIAMKDLTSLVDLTNGSIIWDAAIGEELVCFTHDRIALRRTGGVTILDATTGEMIANLEPDFGNEDYVVIFDNVFFADAGRVYIIGDPHNGEKDLLYTVRYE